MSEHRSSVDQWYVAISVAVAFLAALSLSGRSGWSRRRRLHAVVKDRAMTIQASQVVPVYPLNEDLQPGDVFLVQLPVGLQHEIYEKRGCLPFENPLTRLQPSG
jgi:hypothetical protein